MVATVDALLKVTVCTKLVPSICVSAVMVDTVGMLFASRIVPVATAVPKVAPIGALKVAVKVSVPS